MNRIKVIITAIVVLIVMALIAFRPAPACSTPPKEGTKEKSQLFTVRTDEENRWYPPAVWIITDRETGKEYIVVRTGDGTAMTPRLK